MKHEAPYQDGSREPTRRLSVNLPESLHTRFKTACSAANRRMVREILGFIVRRTEELETGLRDGRWAKPAPPRPPRLSATAKRQLRALDRALERNRARHRQQRRTRHRRALHPPSAPRLDD